MKFGERLKTLRTRQGYSQQKLAELSGLSLRSIQNYESNLRYPNSLATAQKLAAPLGVTAASLMDEHEQSIAQTGAKYGAAAGRELSRLLTEVNGLFAGGELSDDDKDKAMRAITDMYWKSKELNREKYGKKR